MKIRTLHEFLLTITEKHKYCQFLAHVSQTPIIYKGIAKTKLLSNWITIINVQIWVTSTILQLAFQTLNYKATLHRPQNTFCPFITSVILLQFEPIKYMEMDVLTTVFWEQSLIHRTNKTHNAYIYTYRIYIHIVCIYTYRIYIHSSKSLDVVQKKALFVRS